MQNSFPLMKLIAGFASSIILSLFSTSLFSQQSLWITPSDSTEILEFCNRIQSLETISLERIDTTTSGIHEYDPFKKGFYLGLGNIGQPVKSLLPEFKPIRDFNLVAMPWMFIASRHKIYLFISLLPCFRKFDM